MSNTIAVKTIHIPSDTGVKYLESWMTQVAAGFPVWGTHWNLCDATGYRFLLLEFLGKAVHGSQPYSVFEKNIYLYIINQKM